MAYINTYTFKYSSSANIKYTLEIWDQGTNATTWANKKGTLGKKNCQISWGSENAKMYAPLKPSTLTIDFLVTDVLAANYLKQLRDNRQERDVYVYLYNTGTTSVKIPGDSPIFSGYLLMDLAEDPDVSVPYAMKLKAIDGLASLKYYDFIPHDKDQAADHLYSYDDTWLPGNTNSYNSFYPFRQWISRILRYSGYSTTTTGCSTDAEFQTSVNWFNGNMANTTGDPLDWTRATGDQFYKKEGDTGDIKYKPLTCYDALQSICKTWGMRCFVYKNTFYFIGINTYTEDNTGTLASPTNINWHRYTITGSSASPATGSALDLEWGRYYNPVYLTQANKKIAGSQYGVLPAFKKVSVDFLNVSNINYFQGFPKIPQPYPVTTGSGYMLNEETIGTFDFDGTNARTFFQEIYLDFQNNSGGDIRYECRWHIKAKKVGTGTWYQYGYPNWNGTNPFPGWFTMSGLSSTTSIFTRGHLIIPPGGSSFNAITDLINSSWYGSTFNQWVECPATVFTAGDWEFKYETVTEWFSGSQSIAYGHGRCDPIPWTGGTYNTDPDSNFITYTDSSITQGVGSSFFSPIANGIIGTELTNTQIVQAGLDTDFEEVTNVLWGDLPYGGAGRIEIYNGTGWQNSGFQGYWGVDSLTGQNSLAETLCEEIFKRQAQNVRKFSTKINLDALNYTSTDSSGTVPMYGTPFTRWFTPSHSGSATFAANWIMHSGSFDTGSDTWGLVLYEFETFNKSITTTTTGNNGDNSGGVGTNTGSGTVVPSQTAGGVGMTLANPARNNSRAIAKIMQNATRPISIITASQPLGGEGTLTVTSLTVQAIPNAILKSGDTVLVMCQYQPQATSTLDETNTIEYGNVEFVLSSDQSAGATTLSVVSKTIYQTLTKGDVVTISQPDLMAQYQNKTKGTVAGFGIDADGISKGGIEITDWLNSDTMSGAAVTNVPTALSVKNYVDSSVGASDTLQEVTDNGASTTNDITIGSAYNTLYKNDGFTFTDNQDYNIKSGSTKILDLHFNEQKFYISGSEKMRLDSTGLGIGTSSPSRPLSVYRTTAGSVANFLHYTDASNFAGFYIDVSQSTNTVTLNSSGDTAGGYDFQTGNTSRMVILSTGNVGVGTGSPDDFNSNAKNLVVNSSGNTGITIATTSTTSNSSLIFADGTGGTAGYRGAIRYKHDGDYMQFDTAAAEKMRLTSSGRLLIGTSTEVTNSGTVQIVNSTTYQPLLTLRNSGTDASHDIYMGYNRDNSTGSDGWSTGIDSTDNAFHISEDADSINNNVRLKIAAGGNATFSGQVTIPATPVASTDAASKSYVDAQIGANNDLQEVTDNGNTTSQPIRLLNATNVNSKIESNTNLYLNADYDSNSGDAYRNIIFENRGSEKMRLTSDGKLGVGESSPVGLIHAKQTTNDARIIVEVDSNGSSAAGAYFEAKSEFNNYHGVGFFSGTTPTEKWFLGSYGSGSFSIISGTRNAGTKILNVTTDNRVGIGTDAPQSLLHISASSAPVFRMSRTGTGQVWRQEIDSSGRFQLKEAASEGGTSYTRFQIDDTGEVDIYNTLTINNGSGNVEFASSSSGDLTVTSGDDIRLDAGGNDIVLRSSGTEFARLSRNSGLQITSSETNANINLIPNGTGQVIVPVTPTATNSAASKSYVDAQVGTADTLSEVLALGNTSGANDIIMANNQSYKGTHLNGSSVYGLLTLTSGNVIKMGGYDYTSAAVEIGCGDHAKFLIGSTEKMRLDSTGLGIGTTSPAYALQLKGDSTYMSVVAADGSEAVLLGADGNGDGSLVLKDTGGSNKIHLYAESGANNYINNGGNLGINTSSPTEKLHVVGDALISGEVTSSNASGYSVLYGSDRIVSNGTNLYLNFASTHPDVIIGPSDMFRAYVSSGYVSIDKLLVNTTTDSGNAKLQVAGNIELEGSSGRDILFGDNLGAALEFKQGSDLYLRFNTTNGSEDLQVNKQLTGTTANFSGDIAAQEVSATASSYSAGQSEIIYKAQRTGGAVAGDWSYDDATTDMSLGTSTSHSFSLKTGNTRRLTIDNTGTATFSGEVQIASGSVLGWGGNNNFIFGDSSNNYVSIGTNGSQKMRVTSAGELLVGYTSNQGLTANLIVNGNAYFSGNILPAGGILIEDGSSAAPSLRFNNDTDTGLYRAAADTVGIAGALSGTTATFSGNATFGNGGNGKTNFGSSSHYIGNIGANLYSVTSGQSIFYSSTTERMRILANGNVGIAITNPTGILHAYATTGIISESPANAGITIRRNDNVQYSALLKYHSGNSEKWVAGLSDAGDFTGSTGNDYFIGQTKNTPVFLINTSNNVLIGTTTDSGNAKLQVDGNAEVSGNTALGTTVSAVYRLDVNGKARVQSVLELDDVLTLNAIATPSDPANNKSSIWMATDGAIKCKINVNGTVVVRTLASFE